MTVLEPADVLAEERRARAERRSSQRFGGGASEVIVSPMQGTVLRVEVNEGDDVAHGQVLLIVEAMKMENEIAAHRDGIARDLAVAPGDAVRTGQALLKVCPPEDA